MIGYFQLFAEPYVMTQGGPLRSTTSLVLLMYEEGFRWWRMGYAAAIAFVLFIVILLCDADPVPAAERRRERAVMNARRSVGRVAPVTRRAASSGAIIALAADAVDGVGVVHADGRGDDAYPPRLFPSSVTFEHYRALFTRLNLGRYLLNSTLIALTGDGASRW